MDFGRILAPKIPPFWTIFGSKNRSKIKVEKGSIFRESRVIPEVGSAAKAGLQGRSPTRDRDVLGLVKHICIEIIDYDNLFYTPDSTQEGAAAD